VREPHVSVHVLFGAGAFETAERASVNGGSAGGKSLRERGVHLRRRIGGPRFKGPRDVEPSYQAHARGGGTPLPPSGRKLSVLNGMARATAAIFWFCAG